MSDKLEIEGDFFYFSNGLLHRSDGPAVEFKSGIEFWINNGNFHREDGPAITNNKNSKYNEYWLNNKRATSEEIKNIKRNYWIKKIL